VEESAVTNATQNEGGKAISQMARKAVIPTLYPLLLYSEVRAAGS
jgi:hypothetical protein